MRKLKSARGLTVATSIALLALMAATAAVASWRAQTDQDVRLSLQERADLVAALDDARAQFFLNTTLLATTALAGADQRPSLTAQYTQDRPIPGDRLSQARADMVALGETADVASLDQLAASVEDVQKKTDTAIYLFQGTDATPETIVQMAEQYEPTLWPPFEQITTQVDQLARAEQAKLASVRGAADRASVTTLALLIGLSVATFLVALATLAAFTLWLVRPLASLKAKARAVTSGHWDARAEVSGLEETSSLARDFNEMTQTLVEGATQVKDSEGRFRDVLEVSRDLVYKLNLKTRTYDYVSPSSLDLLGFAPDEITAMGLDEVRDRFHPDDRQRFSSFGGEGSRDAAADRKALGIEYRWKCKDGEYRWLSDDRAFVRNEEGKVVAVVGTVRDITSRKQAEAALCDSEERFRTLSATAPIGIFLSDAQGNGVYSNENAVVLIGGTTEDGLGRIWTKYVHPDDREALMAEGAAASAAHRKFSMEYRILTKAGEVRWVHTTIVAIRSAEGVITGYVGTIEDVTDRKRAEEEMADRLRIESAIAQASNLLAASDDTDTALNLVLRVLGEAFGAERAHIYMLEGKTKMHCVARWCAPEAEEVSDVYDFDAGAFLWSTRKALQAEPIIVNDTDTLPPEAAAEKSIWQSLGIRSIVVVSLTSGGRVIGSIGIDTMHSTCVRRDEDVKLLRLAAESISAFIERQRAAAEKRDAYESIVFLLATAAEARDPYTENHLHRIKSYSEAIALELGLSPEEAEEIGLAALLHDLGKIRVPDSILTKPGPLSEDEWHIMRKHPIWGEELLPPDPWFKKARRDRPLASRELGWDGLSGRPSRRHDTAVHRNRLRC